MPKQLRKTRGPDQTDSNIGARTGPCPVVRLAGNHKERRDRLRKAHLEGVAVEQALTEPEA